MQRLRKIAAKLGTRLLLALISIALFLFVAELILRLTPYKKLLTTPPRYRFKADAEAGYDLAENLPPVAHAFTDAEYQTWSNELGCFDRPYNGEDNYVLLMGDSFTEGYTPFEQKWGTLIETLLDRRVLKCGVSGYGTHQELIKASRLLTRIGRPPQLIVVGYFWNDLVDDYLFPRGTVVDGYSINTKIVRNVETGEITSDTVSREVIAYWLRLRSVIYNLGRQARRAVARHSAKQTTAFDLVVTDSAHTDLYYFDYAWWKEARRQHLQNLKQFEKLAEQHAAQLLVVIIPTKNQVYPFLREPLAEETRDPNRPNRLLAEFLQGEQINFIDLLPFFRHYADPTPRKGLDSARDLYWQIDDHWNPNGNRLAALLVGRFILQHNLVSIADRDESLRRIEQELSAFERH